LELPGHDWHELNPVLAAYLLVLQSEHVLDPVLAEYLPAAQLLVQVVAPTIAEYWPAKQLLHVASPNVVLNFPGTHSMHGPPSGPDNPALHVQALLPAGEVDCAGQLTQGAFPLSVLYDPATH